MQQLYYESRNLPVRPHTPLAADIARHLHMRQYLGAAVVVCDTPTITLSAVRKQWVKATRALQRQRASTLNPEEILRLTHVIIHMQNMRFVAKTPIQAQQAAVYFLTPEQLTLLPKQCLTMYVTSQVAQPDFVRVCDQLPHAALVVTYDNAITPNECGLQPKHILEDNIRDQWQNLCNFLQAQNIEPTKLVVGGTLQFTAMDTALDTLLDVSHGFLSLAANFQHSLNLGQPFTTIPSNQQKIFAAITRLAHRVQSLAPGSFTGYLNGHFGDTSTELYFLRDAGAQLYLDLEAAEWQLQISHSPAKCTPGMPD